jgi:pimeloyl-ACP methyl ester carboxylesterase
MASSCASLIVAALFALAAASPARAQTSLSVEDILSRPGVTQRVLVLSPPQAKATVVLFSGGNGALQLRPDGGLGSGSGNFLVRSRQLFVDAGLMVVLIDAPSDRQSDPFLAGFRQRPEHAADVKATIAWLRARSGRPVWLVGTSRGTQSVAYVATELAGRDGPDGIVLTSTILVDRKSRAVPAMPLEKIRIPVLVVHHEKDACPLCPFGQVGSLMAALENAPRKQLFSFKDGRSQGDPCEAFAYHGYNGIEPEVVRQIAGWVLAN